MKFSIAGNIFLFVVFHSINCKELETRLDETKIVGGNLIDISKAPYQASLAYDDQFFCGASIISTQYLLTAAHCKLELIF
jgi:secreted trypsin-like serine protease